MALALVDRNLVVEEFDWMLNSAMSPPIRSLFEFAEQELVLPNGPFEDDFWREDMQPWAALFIKEVEKQHKEGCNHINLMAPTQSGKTLNGQALICMYHTCEKSEDFVVGVPDLKMANDKWKEDIQPVLKASAYQDLLPITGPGSRDGDVKDAVRLRNGRTIKFMSGGAGGRKGDSQRSGFTTPAIGMTEVDKYDMVSKASRESDPVTQMVERVSAFGDDAKIYKECTITTTSGRIFRDWWRGTASQIIVKCVHCKKWILPTRASLRGWQDAETAKEAKNQSEYCCELCGGAWTEDQRAEMNMKGKIVHRGDKHWSVGMDIETELLPKPGLNIFGLRVTCFNNLFQSAGIIGETEWSAEFDEEADESDKGVKIYKWVIPHEPEAVDLTPLDHKILMKRQGGLGPKIVPGGTIAITVGVDVRQRELHWVAVAWFEDASSQIIQYNIEDVPYRTHGKRSVLFALRDLRNETFKQGWCMEGTEQRLYPDCIFIDSRFETKPVCGFCQESGEGYFPVLGVGDNSGTKGRQVYSKPKDKTKSVRVISEEYHFEKIKIEGLRERVLRCHIDSNHWKNFVHTALHVPATEPGAMVLFKEKPLSHRDFCLQLTAETQRSEFIPGRGEVIVWDQERQNNHFFDCVYYASTAGHYCGIRLIKKYEKEVEVEKMPLQQTGGSGEAKTSYFSEMRKKRKRR